MAPLGKPGSMASHRPITKVATALLWLVATVVALAMSACGSSSGEATSTSSGEAPASGTSLTIPPASERHLVFPDPVEWSGAQPPGEEFQTIVSNLEDLETWALWPPGPPRDTEGGLGAIFSVGRYEPTGEVDVHISMSPAADWGVVWEAGDPGPAICEGGGATVEVRGYQGCILEPGNDDDFILGWAEGGLTMSMAVRGLSLDETLTWLDRWTRIPEA